MIAWIVIGIVLFLLVVIASGRMRAHHLSGNLGEAVVAGRLAELPSETYTILNDVMLPTKDGTTTQVDHVVVSRFGIFVIETKDYSGWIFGGEKQREWTQSFHVGWGMTEKHHFQNPIRQNWRHIYTMAELLKLPKHYFRNVVAFCGEGELKTEMPSNVMYSRRLAGYIRSFEIPVMSEESVRKASLSIRAWEATLSDERRTAHVENLKARHDPARLSVAVAKGELKCPKCGSPMVLRHRRSDGGAFYGCSKYPNCKGIINAG